MDAYETLISPISTEKSMRLMESQNTLIFAVHRKATKPDVKKAVEELFGVKVTNVNTVVNTAGEKRAFVRFGEDTPAIDVATQLGIM